MFDAQAASDVLEDSGCSVLDELQLSDCSYSDLLTGRYNNPACWKQNASPRVSKFCLVRNQSILNVAKFFRWKLADFIIVLMWLLKFKSESIIKSSGCTWSQGGHWCQNFTWLKHLFPHAKKSKNEMWLSIFPVYFSLFWILWLDPCFYSHLNYYPYFTWISVIQVNVSFIPKPGIKQSILCIVDVTKTHIKHDQ